MSHIATRTPSILASSAVMAAGTMVSRITGIGRSALLVAALGNGLRADSFNLANTIPNMLYILLAGGVFNAVLVPQLVRAQRNDPDGGTAYTDRIITLAGLFLGVVTVVLVVAAPLLMRIYLARSWYAPDHAEYLSSAIAFARWCLPQIFFYGMFVLVGQVLNARRRFGPMMWAPIANNIIAIAVLAIYLFVYGPAASGGFSTAEEVLLGLGSTLGIVAQFLLLLPVLRAAGVRYTPRFDFKGTGLSHTFRLGTWTVLFVAVNQVAYTFVTRLASSGSAGGGTGYTIYSNSFVVTQVPHSIITVSLATAIMPVLSARAAANDLPGLGRTLAGTLRSTLALIIPIAALMALLAVHVAHLLFGYGATRDTYRSFAPTIALFAPGMVFFTVHYLMLRGFYAQERNRAVFWIQCGVAATNIVAAVLLVRATTVNHTSPALVVAYSLSYLVGAATSYAVLRRSLGDFDTPRLVQFLARLLIITTLATASSWVFKEALLTYDRSPSWIFTLLEVIAIGIVFVCMLLLGARAFRVTELTSVIGQVARRLGLN